MTKRNDPGAPMRQWLAVPMPDDIARALWKIRHAPGVCRVAVMPDVHLAGDVCIGTVVATRDLLYPAAVGSDIGCGMAAVAFHAEASLVDRRETADTMLEDLHRIVPVIRRPSPIECPWLDRTRLSDPALDRLRARDARYELGTVGRGNHFVEFQEDLADGRLWLMVHSGSRCMGEAIREHHEARADGSKLGLRYINARGDAGASFRADVGWARGYAAWNRRIIVRLIGQWMRERFGVALAAETWITCDHNHVKRERHGGDWLWVHRKGAVDATEGRLGVIPGSMGSVSHHVEGRGCAEALRSCSHGAGRAMPRAVARRQVTAEHLDRQLEGVWYDRAMASRLVEEAPCAYRDISKVMRAQRDLVRSVRRLRPIVCYKGA